MRSASKRGLRKSGRPPRRRRHTEIEVKLRIAGKRRLLGQLARLKARLIRPRVHEMNTLFDTPEGKLARQGQMLRLRVERPSARSNRAGKARQKASGKSGTSALLTFKGPPKGPRANTPGRYKIREERELRIREYGKAPRILEALGVRPWFRYEKFRTVFELPRMRSLKLALDETPIGLFLELEGPPGEIDRAAELLGFDRSGYITQSYGALFMEQCGLSHRISGRASHKEPVPFSGVADMLFGTKKGVR